MFIGLDSTTELSQDTSDNVEVNRNQFFSCYILAKKKKSVFTSMLNKARESGNKSIPSLVCFVVSYLMFYCVYILYSI